MPATIVFASFTGEEAGLLGSREFVRRAVERKTQIVGASNNDMIGWANDQRLDNTIRYSNPGIRDVQHGAAMLFTKLITYDALYFKSTDAAAYYDAYGDIVGGIGSHPVLSNPHYHQAARLSRVHQPSTGRRDQQDHRRDADAAGVEPIAADQSQGRWPHDRRDHRVMVSESGEGRELVRRELWHWPRHHQDSACVVAGTAVGNSRRCQGGEHTWG